MANTIFLTTAAGWAFPFVRPEGIHYVTFVPGLNTVENDDLFDQVLAHPCSERKEALGEIVFYDGRKEGKDSDLGLKLVDVKGSHAEDGVPIADAPNATSTAIGDYRNSDHTKGTEKKSTKTSRATGHLPLPSE